MRNVFVCALAASACASEPAALPRYASAAAAARPAPPIPLSPEPPVPAMPVALSPAPPPAASAPSPPPVALASVASPNSPWAHLQAYLPALAGIDHDREFQLVGAYAASSDADAYWQQLAQDLDAGHGSLDHTCAATTAHVLALLIDDPASSQAIGRREPNVRVFWMPLASVASMTVAQAIRAAGLVDGPAATTVARNLRQGQTPDAWIAAVERSQAWFLPAGDDPTIHHRRIRGYAVASLPELRPHLVYLGTNMLGGFCEVATVAIDLRGDRRDGITGGPVHSGDDAVCELTAVRELPECRR